MNIEDVKTQEEAEELWIEANFDRCCSCHINPPCSFCVDGFSLTLEEYLEQFEFEPEEAANPYEDFDRAMKSLV